MIKNKEIAHQVDLLKHNLAETTNRFERIIAQKEKGLEELKSSDTKRRAFGKRRLTKITGYEVTTYPIRLAMTQDAVRAAAEANAKVNQLLPPQGMLKKWAFKRAHKQLTDSVTHCHSHLHQIEEDFTVLISTNQKMQQLINANLSGDQEAQLRKAIELEIERTHRIIANLKACGELTVSCWNGLGKAMQAKYSAKMEAVEEFGDEWEAPIVANCTLNNLLCAMLGLSAAGALAADMNETAMALGIAAAGSAILDKVLDYALGFPTYARMMSSKEGFKETLMVAARPYATIYGKTAGRAITALKKIGTQSMEVTEAQSN